MEVMPNKMVRAGEEIFSQGDDADGGLYYICYGKVLVTHIDANGQRHMSELGEGDVFGEMALINSDVRNATVTAKEDCGFFVLTRENFQEKVKLLEPIMRGAFRTLVVTIRSMLEQRQKIEAECLKMQAELREYKQHADPASASRQSEYEEPVGGRKLQF